MFFLTAPSTLVESVTMSRLTLVGTPNLNKFGTMGRGTAGNGSSTYASFNVAQTAMTQWTIFAVVHAPSATVVANTAAFALGHSTGNPIVSLLSGLVSGNKVRVFSRDDGINDSATADTTAGVFDGLPHIVHLRFCKDDGGTYRLEGYIDGFMDTQVSAGGGTQTFTVNRVAIGCLLRGSAALFCNASVYLAGASNRAWTKTEIENHANNPWQVFAPRRMPVYGTTAAAAAVAYQSRVAGQAVNRASTY